MYNEGKDFWRKDWLFSSGHWDSTLSACERYSGNLKSDKYTDEIDYILVEEAVLGRMKHASIVANTLSISYSDNVCSTTSF